MKPIIRVLANGCFDLLHVAHVRHLEEARAMGDELVVALTIDECVGKPGRPIVPQQERMEMLWALRYVTAVGFCRDSLDALATWQPQIFCKGADYLDKGLLPAELDYCRAHGIEIRHTKPNPQTTSGIIERIRCAS